MEVERSARAILQEARQAMGSGDPTAAIACCDRALVALGNSPSPAVRALERYCRAFADIERLPSMEVLTPLAQVLPEHGEWEPAMETFSSMAAQAVDQEDLPAARKWLVHATGCAEAGGARRLTASLLNRLAEAEIKQGDPHKALSHVQHALWRLQDVPLLGARAEEAHCLSALGDAHHALGDLEQARLCWEDARGRYERLEHGSGIRKVSAKLNML